MPAACQSREVARPQTGESIFAHHDKCRICLPDKSGIYHVYEAKTSVSPVISTKSYSRTDHEIVREAFLCSYSSVFQALFGEKTGSRFCKPDQTVIRYSDPVLRFR